MKLFFSVKYFLLFVCIVYLFSACSGSSEPKVFVKTVEGTSVSIDKLYQHKLNAIVFLAPGCPLSEAALLSLTALDSLYRKNDYATFIIIPGNLYTQKEVELFKDSFDVSFPILIDTNYYLTHKLKASITPEYFLLNENKVILYQGAIDDRALDNDIIRQEARVQFAQKAIEDVLLNRKVEISKTKAVGCYIEQ